jgi:chromosome segregation ATPase
MNMTTEQQSATKLIQNLRAELGQRNEQLAELEQRLHALQAQLDEQTRQRQELHDALEQIADLMDSSQYNSLQFILEQKGITAEGLTQA